MRPIWLAENGIGPDAPWHNRQSSLPNIGWGRAAPGRGGDGGGGGIAAGSWQKMQRSLERSLWFAGNGMRADVP